MLFTPHFFIFGVVYIIFAFSLVFVDVFFYFWVLIELSTLVFIGMSYSVFKNSVSSLLVFFIIQAISAFILLVFYLLEFSLIISVAMSLKLSMFPFHFWFINLVVMFPNLIFFIARTFYKLPSLFMLNFFPPFFRSTLLIISGVFTLFLGGLMIIFSSDLRFILICSSVSNNTWFYLSQFCGILSFLVYWIFYSFFLAIVFLALEGSMSFSYKLGGSDKIFVLLSLFSMSGLPPFPLFFIKMFVVFSLFYSLYSIHLFFVLLITLLLLVGYIKFCFTYIYSIYSSPVSFFITF